MIRTALLCASVLSSIAGAAHAVEFTVKSRPIAEFRIGSTEQRFGPLEFAGGLEMIGSSQHFGAWSAIDLGDNQSDFAGVLDTGFFISGRIERDNDHRPIGLTAVSLDEMTGADGAIIGQKWKVDAEGLAVSGDHLFVSFERAHRISDYRRNADGSFSLLSEAAPPVPLYELRDNRGFEGIALAPASTAFPGALVGVSEKSLDKAGNIMAFVRKTDGSSFEFSVKRTGDYDVTDIAFLPDGDLVVLERLFSISQGIGMRLRQISASDITKGATVDGAILLDANMLNQIDNMEGLNITTDADGTPRLTIVSDDNHSLLQRNLLLEFRLVGPVPPLGQ